MKILRGAAVAILLSFGLLSQSALAARSNCAQQFMRDMVSCSQLGSFWDRGACGLDAGVTLVACVFESIPRFSR